jgi:anti-sigma regulatory factor (Ser/Thr protein kinase)
MEGDIVPFVRGGLDAGESAVVVCSAHPAQVLKAALGSEPRLRFLEAEEVYGRTPQTLLAVQQLVDEELEAGAARIRTVGEPVLGARLDAWSEGIRYEAIVNRTLARYPVWGVCLFDQRTMPAEVLEAARRTHPYVRTPGGRAANPGYLDPTEALGLLPGLGPDPLEATTPTLEVGNLTNLRWLRQKLDAAMAGSELPAGTVGEFIFAASEVATNALRHGLLPVRVRVWVTPHRLLCTITDAGPGVSDPLIGYVPAHRDPARGGLGLWLARRLCDQVELRRGSDGFTVRLATGD